MSDRKWNNSISVIYESIYDRSWSDQDFKYESIARMLRYPEENGDKIIDLPMDDLSETLLQYLSQTEKMKILAKLQDFLNAGGNDRLKKKIIELAKIVSVLEIDMANRSLTSDFDPQKNE